jgi:hypothetical protein
MKTTLLLILIVVEFIWILNLQVTVSSQSAAIVELSKFVDSQEKLDNSLTKFTKAQEQLNTIIAMDLVKLTRLLLLLEDKKQ